MQQERIIKNMVGYLETTDDNIYKIKHMGLVNRKKSGKKLNGTKMIVEGQGVSTVAKPTPFSGEKLKLTPVNNQQTN
jgi:hypothetical protein